MNEEKMRQNNVKYLVGKYGIDDFALEKFTDEKLKKLIRVCKAIPINLAKLIDDYEDTTTALSWYRESTLDDYLSGKQRVAKLVLPKHKQDPRVEKTLASLYEKLLTYEPELTGLSAGGLLWGSFYFGDPSTDPDLDFDFICPDPSDDPEKALAIVSDELGKELSILTHCRTIYLSEFKQDLNDILKGDLKSLTYEANSFIIDIPILLISEPIYLPFCNTKDIKQKLEEIREDIDQAALKNALIRGILVNKFETIEQDRHLKVRPVYGNE